MRWSYLLCAFLGASAACRPVESAEEQAARGASLYREHCFSCHDVDGAIGVELSERVLRYHRTARVLYDYVALAMPYGAPGTLSEDQYLSITAYLLRSRHLWRAVRALTPGGLDTLALQ